MEDLPTSNTCCEYIVPSFSLSCCNDVMIQVTRGDVDSFNPGTSAFPSLQLKARVLRPEEEVQYFRYVLNLIGAREPKNKLLVEVDPPAERIGGMYFI